MIAGGADEEMDRKRLRLSLSQQWLLIALVAMVPLLLVAAYATWSLYQQMHRQRVIVQRVDMVSHVQSSVVDQVRELERSARQYRLLRDPRFLELYGLKRGGLQQAQIELSLLVPDAGLMGNELVAEQQHPLMIALTLLNDTAALIKRSNLNELDDGEFSELLTSVNQFRTDFDRQISTHVQRLTEEGERDLQAILWRLSLLGVITLPLTLVLMAMGLLQMIRPVRRLSAAIRNLGQGDWQSPIDVAGPSDLQELGERLEWMRGQLLETDRQKQTFLRHISHELKTPLSAIMEAGSLLQDEVPGPMSAQQQAVLQILVRNSKSLQEQIQQLLNYNVLTYSFKSHHAEVDLRELCLKIALRLDQHAHTHGVIWDIAQTRDTVSTDPQLLEMMLANLLSNAFYYSPSGSVIRVRWECTPNECWISVEDQGPGIPEAEREQIFEPFSQGSARRHGPLRGSGVGLAIVRESINNLGGSIEIESAPESGSKFTLRFPLS